jgi:carbonic anhydrase
LNAIPLSCLAAILLVTGVKLVSPALVKQMWSEGRYQFIPFAVTIAAIVLTDLLIGVLIGLAVSISFILHSNMRRPIRRFVEKHLGGDVVHIELANQESFLNRAALSKVLAEVPRSGHVLLDAQNTDYIDPDVLDLIRDFTEQTGPARGVKVSLLGFRSSYQLLDQTQYVDYSTRDLQDALTPQQVLQILKDGHERFRTGRRLTRDLGRQELIFDLGVGDIFSVRIAGNLTSRKILGSAEYGCAVAGAKLILVMGHTRCGAVTAAVNLICSTRTASETLGCQHLDYIVNDIQQSTDQASCRGIEARPAGEQESLVNAVARRNVSQVVERMRAQSRTLDALVREGRIVIVGAMYDVVTGEIEFLAEDEMNRKASLDPV